MEKKSVVVLMCLIVNIFVFEIVLLFFWGGMGDKIETRVLFYERNTEYFDIVHSKGDVYISMMYIMITSLSICAALAPLCTAVPQSVFQCLYFLLLHVLLILAERKMHNYPLYQFNAVKYYQMSLVVAASRDMHGWHL